MTQQHDPSLHEVESFGVDDLSMDQSSAGFLEWLTGIIRLNVDVQEFTPHDGPRIRYAIPIDFSEVMQHEQIHFIQMAISGFLYAFCTTVYSSLFDWVASFDTVASIPQDLPSDIVSTMRHRVQRLDRVGQDDISVRTLVEGHALFCQKRLADPGLTHDSYTHILMTGGYPDEYRHSYEVCASYLGEASFSTFGILSALSLCSLNPESAFSMLARSISKEGMTYTRANILQFLELFNATIPERTGVSAEIYQMFPRHPLYTNAMFDIHEYYDERGESVYAYLAEPYADAHHLHTKVSSPIFFNRKDGRYWTVLHPENWLPGWSKDDKLGLVEILHVIANLSSRVLRNLDRDGPVH